MANNRLLQLRVNYSVNLNPKTGGAEPTAELILISGEPKYRMGEKEIERIVILKDDRVFVTAESLKENIGILTQIHNTLLQMEPLAKSITVEPANVLCAYQKDGSKPCVKQVYQCGVCKEHYAVLLENDPNADEDND